MSDTLRAAILFLITTLFDIYIAILIIRLILVYISANYFDPLTQFIIKLTDFIVKPLRRFIPNLKNFELASIFLILVLEIIKFFLVSILSFGVANILGLVVLAFADILKLVILIFFYAIILEAIMTWVQPMAPVNRVLHQITLPVLRPLRRVIPPIAGFDITPIPALIILQLLIILIVNPLMAYGLSVAFQ